MKKYTLILFTLAIVATSCKDSYDEKAVDETLTSFLEAMRKPVDFDKMKDSYVGFSFSSVPSVSKYNIKSLKVENGDVIAEISTTYRKIARVSSADFILKLNEVDGAWKITNSKGMSNYKMMFPTEYKYAVDNKLIDESEELWDVELGKIIKKEDK